MAILGEPIALRPAKTFFRNPHTNLVPFMEKIKTFHSHLSLSTATQVYDRYILAHLRCTAVALLRQCGQSPKNLRSTKWPKLKPLESPNPKPPRTSCKCLTTPRRGMGFLRLISNRKFACVPTNCMSSAEALPATKQRIG